DTLTTTDQGVDRPSTFVSFRDPSGHLVVTNHRILRVVSDDYQATAKRFLQSSLSSDLIQEHLLVGTKQLSIGSATHALQDLGFDTSSGMVLEHEPVAFASYPYE